MICLCSIFVCSFLFYVFENDMYLCENDILVCGNDMSAFEVMGSPWELSVTLLALADILPAWTTATVSAMLSVCDSVLRATLAAAAAST